MSRRIAVAMLAVGVASATLATEPRRGAVAFNYSGSLSRQQLDFYARFDVLVTHDPLPQQHVDFLHERGTKLVLYEWSVAFYESLVKPGSFQETLLAGDRRALLNAQPLRGEAGSPIADAWYYDPASPVHREERPRAIARHLRAIGYDGLFFDTTTLASVHTEARAEYERRHENLPYDEAFATFLAALRREIPSITIVTNQGYRAAGHYLPYADYDITESLITRPSGDRFAFRPWDDSNDPWNSLAFLVRNLIDPLRPHYPEVRFVHLNYLRAMRRHDITSIIAVARLFGDDAFVTSASVEARGEEIHDAYFIDLGLPHGAIESTATSAKRNFEHGLIAVNASARRVTVDGVRIAPSRDGLRGVIHPRSGGLRPAPVATNE